MPFKENYFFFLNSELFTSDFSLVLPCLRHVRKGSFDSLFINKYLLSKFDIALQHHYKWKTTATTSLSLQEINLLRSLLYISHRYFAPGRPLVISSPATYRDVQKELIAEIHRTALWPLVVTVDGNISKPNKTDFIDRDGSYIIVIPDGNIKSLHREINGLCVDRNEFTRVWKTEARFFFWLEQIYSQ